MQLDKTKKYKGVQLLKLEPQYFGNAKKYSRQKSSNEIPIIKYQSSANVGKSLRRSPCHNSIKLEEEKVTGIDSYNTHTKNILKKISSFGKANINNINNLSEFLFLRKVQKKKEGKKDSEKYLSKFRKGNQNKHHHKSFSCKNVCSLKNQFLSKKSKVINSINIKNENNNNNNNDFNNKINTNSKIKTGSNDITKEKNVNNKENIINDYKSVNIITIKNNSENITTNGNTNDSKKNKKNKKKNNSIKKKSTFKQLFCCL